ncbi:MAG: DUF2892 domain-containing protein [Chlorobiaceae bacterium]|nr:DUF2892 domain-containing protein [Chlorobiaceae bacterium]
MKKKMGNTDRIIRAIAGVIIPACGIVLRSWWGVIGAVVPGTSLISFCPLYNPLGISTGGKCNIGA